MSQLFSNYKRKNVEFVKGEQTELIDKEGKKYIDFSSGIGVANLGYNHSLLNQALSEQLKQLWHTPNLYENQLQETVAKQLARGQNYLGYFCNSGAEANEAAIKLARKYTGRSQIITFTHSFHGRTYGAMSATAQEVIHEGFQPLVPDFVYLPFNELEPIKKVINHKTAAVMVELIQGEGGVVPADITWIQAISALCKQVGALLIIDEIQTGIGRTGNFYAYEGYGIEPDIFTLAKGLGNGIPVGAMLGKQQLNTAFGPGSHGSTFGGNKLALSVASKVIETIDQVPFLESVTQKANQLFQELKPFVQMSHSVVDVRGKGLMVGVEMKSSINIEQIIDDAQMKGLVILKAGRNTLRLLPPLTITEEELMKGIAILKKCLNKGETK